jgi:hypothetical protein
LAGAKLYTYATGTSTPKAVYADAALTVALSNPVIADSAGRFPAMFLGAGDYKTELRDAAEVVIATDDPVEGDAATAASDIATAALAARRNRLVNPAMQISQQFGTSNTDCTTGTTYTLDQWAAALSTTPGGTLRIAQVASVTPGGSPFRLRATVQASDGTIAADNRYYIEQPIEGQMMADARFGSSAAKQVFVRLGVRSSIAGTFGVSLANSAGTRSWVGLINISAGEINTDLVRTLTLTGDTSGTWLTDNGIGCYVRVCLAAGTTFQGVTGWQAGNIPTTSGQTNFMGTGSATFELFDTGFYVDTAGAGVIPPFELPDPADELRRCRRYWRTLGHDMPLRFPASAGGQGAYWPIRLDPPMRVAPTASASFTGANGNVASSAVNRITTDGATAELNNTAAGDTLTTLQASTTFAARM